MSGRDAALLRPFFCPQFFCPPGLAQYRTPYGIFTLLSAKIYVNNNLEDGAQDEKIGISRYDITTNLVHKFTQGSKEIYGQRREVTVLVVEIADFLSASEELDSESIYLAVDEIVHLLANTVYKYEGTIDKYTGHGLLALFGIPLNHENDPERAVRAARDRRGPLPCHGRQTDHPAEP